MPRVVSQQTDFTAGELDPRLLARKDIEFFFRGAERLRNVILKPQGGVERRPGTRYVDEVMHTLSAVDLTAGGVTVTAPNGGTAANATDGDDTTELETTTSIGTINPYVIAHVDLGSAVAVKFADAEGLRLKDGSTASLNEVRWQYSTDNAAWSDLGNPFDRIDTDNRSKRRRGPQTARYWRLVRVGATDLGTDDFVVDEIALWSETATLSPARLKSFVFSQSQKYIFVLTDRNIAVYTEGTLTADIPTPYTSADIETFDTKGNLETVRHAQSLDTMFLTHPDYQPRKVFRDGADDEWTIGKIEFDFIPTHPFERVTKGQVDPGSFSGTTFSITLSNTSDMSAADVGVRWFRGGGGYGLVKSRDSATVYSISQEELGEAAPANLDFPGGSWSIEEPAWSTTRGWPIAVQIFGGRLWFCGTRRLPGTVWGSRAGVLFNFSIGSGDPDDAIEITVSSREAVTFHAIHNGRHLQFITSSRAYYIPASDTEAITPENAVLRSTSVVGSKGLAVVEVEGGTFYIARGGKSLREMIFTDTEQAYKAEPISLLASHLLNDPRDLTKRDGTDQDDANLIHIVNGDGTVAVLALDREQGVNGFTQLSTAGSFKSAAVDYDDTYWIVERTINGATVRYLERFDATLLVDAGASGGAASSATGLTHLEGETVGLILDGAIQPDQTVTGGTVTFPRASTTSYQVGLRWPDLDGSGAECWIKDMPTAPQLPEGGSDSRKRRVVEAIARVHDTNGLKINAEEIPFQSMGSGLLDSVPAKFSGLKGDGVTILGWDDKGQVELSAPGMFNFHVLGLSKKVAI